LQVGDEAATTWSSGGRRVTCPACRAALDDAQPQDVHLRSVTPITPVPTPPGGIAAGEHGPRGAVDDGRLGPVVPASGYDPDRDPTPWQTHSGDDDFPPHVHAAIDAEDAAAAGDPDDVGAWIVKRTEHLPGCTREHDPASSACPPFGHPERRGRLDVDASDPDER
jgi:hypothetical protein